MWKCISAVIGVLLIGGSPAKAAVRVILCDTPEQIEQVFTLHADGTTFEEAVEATNSQAGRPNACSKVTVEATLVGAVRGPAVMVAVGQRLHQSEGITNVRPP